MRQIKISIGICTICLISIIHGSSQSLTHEISIAGNLHFLSNIDYIKGSLFVSEDIKSQALPGAQMELSVFKKSESHLEPGIGLKMSYLVQNTYLELLYPEDIMNSTSSKYSSISNDLGITIMGQVKWKLNNCYVDFGLGYHNSFSHTTNSLIKRGFDKGKEELPDGESKNLKGPEISVKFGYIIKKFISFVGGNLALYQESYTDPTSGNYWKGRPNTLFLGVGLKF